MIHIDKPTSKKAIEFVTCQHKEKPDKTTLLVIGDCMVKYQGRAKSILDWGERIIIIKQDGSVLVHKPTMREPVNWQPPETRVDFKQKNDDFIIHTYHTNPTEKMDIIFRDIQTIFIAPLRDHAELAIAGMEKDIKKNIMEEPCVIEEGLRIMEREKTVKSGLIDFFAYDENHMPVVIEVKRSLATIPAVHQLRMYVNDMKRDQEDAQIRGILCAPKIPDMVKHLLDDYNLEWQEFEPEIFIPDDKQTKLSDFF